MATDFSELAGLAADLRSAPAEVAPFVKKALKVTAMDIKKGWAARAARAGEGVAAGYPGSIDFDERDSVSGPSVEIGPNLGKYGGRSGFQEDAPGGVESAPLHAGRDAVEDNEADFVRGLEIAVADGLAKALGAS